MDKLTEAGVNIFLGDCLKVMKLLPKKSIDVVLCDPPYGIDYQSCRIKDKSRRKPKIANDKKPFVEFISELPRLLKRDGAVFIFTKWTVQQAFIDELERNGMSPKNIIIWDKRTHGMGDLKRSFGSRYESIIFCAMEDFRFSGKRPIDIVSFTKVPASRLVHPNEKPIPLLEYLLEVCLGSRGGVVLDMTMGAGSTGLACVKKNYGFVGVEIDEKYFRLAYSRLKNDIRKPPPRVDILRGWDEY